MKLEQIRKQAAEKFFRALKARDLEETFKGYLDQEKKLIYEEWKVSDVERWKDLKMKLEVLEELEQMISNDAKNASYYKQTVEELEQIKEE